MSLAGVVMTLEAKVKRLETELSIAREEIAAAKAYEREMGAALNARKAALGRAVAVLQEARQALPGGYATIEELIDKVDAVLADAESSASGEAWREEQEFISASLQQRHFDCLHDAEHRCKCGTEASKIDERVETALAKVDARRGGGR